MSSLLVKKLIVLLLAPLLVLTCSGIAHALAPYELTTARTSSFHRFFDLWRVDTQTEFEQGILESVDTASSPGNVKLAVFEGPYYIHPGIIASKVYDTVEVGAGWDLLGWDETLPSGTNITFEVRASDTVFDKSDSAPPWQDASAVPIAGRYQQWRATLNTTDDTVTPILHEVWVLYSW